MSLDNENVVNCDGCNQEYHFLSIVIDFDADIPSQIFILLNAVFINVQCAVCSVYCVVCSVQCAVCSAM